MQVVRLLVGPVAGLSAQHDRLRMCTVLPVRLVSPLIRFVLCQINRGGVSDRLERNDDRSGSPGIVAAIPR